MQNKIIALVPMRHHSQRVPKKNFRLIAGKPLFHHILNTLLECNEIDHILVDTDSPIIIDDIHKNFSTILITERPDHLRADDIPMNEVLANDVQNYEADFYLQTHSTNPLLKAKTISKAINSFLENYPIYDSLFSVTQIQSRLWDQLSRPINHNSNILLQTQDLPPVYEENSCLYIFTRDILLKKHNRIGDRPLMYTIKPEESWDIDNELDFKITEFLMNQSDK
jgi:CMP-N-acetylneuraminic acid synthetase